MKISARNQLSGKVINVQEGAVTAIVTVDIGNEKHITSSISLEALKELDIKIGSEVTAIIKATSVMLGI